MLATWRIPRSRLATMNPIAPSCVRFFKGIAVCSGRPSKVAERGFAVCGFNAVKIKELWLKI